MVERLASFALDTICKCGQPTTRVLVMVEDNETGNDIILSMKCDLCARTLEAMFAAGEGSVAQA